MLTVLTGAVSGAVIIDCVRLGTVDGIRRTLLDHILNLSTEIIRILFHICKLLAGEIKQLLKGSNTVLYCCRYPHA